MNTKINKPESSGVSLQTTTAQRELLGWSGAVTYMFSMMFGYQIFIVGNMGFTNGSIVGSAIMMAFAVSIAIFGFLFGRSPNRLSRIAFYTTPIAIVATATLGLFSDVSASALYILAAIFMGPAISRNVYGVIRTANPDKRITQYMIGWAIALTVFAFWVVAALPREIAYLIPALFAVLAWVGIRRSVSIPDEKQPPKAYKFSLSSLFVIVSLVLAMIWFNLMADMLQNNLFAGGDVSSESVTVLGTLVTWISLAISLALYSILSDRGYERQCFMGSMAFFLISIMSIILLDDKQSVVFVPLTIASVIGAMYGAFFAYSFPIYFHFSDAKRPVLVASVCCIFFTAFQSICWQKSLYLPQSLIVLGTPLYISAGISAVLFIVPVYFLYERHREKTLVASLYSLLHDGTGGEAPTFNETITAETSPLEETLAPPQTQGMTDAGLTQREIKIAMLLIEGETQHSIARKLNMNAAEYSQQEKAIRQKLNLMGDSDPAIAAVVTEYKLTKRETEMLKYLRDNLTTEQIAAEVYITEDTVRYHIRNLLKKLDIERWQDVSAWLDKYK